MGTLKPMGLEITIPPGRNRYRARRKHSARKRKHSSVTARHWLVLTNANRADATAVLNTRLWDRKLIMKKTRTPARGDLRRGFGSPHWVLSRVSEDVLTHWNEPVEGRNISKGMAMKPAEYVKAVLSIMPKELIFSDPTTAVLNLEQVDALLMKLRQDVLAPAVSEDGALN
jgi:hypothetical protein